MDAGDLKICQAVAREGSISKAALALNYVQSNVTTRIKQLEDQLKVPLFHRSNRGMSLTPAGENLLGNADRILHLLYEAEQARGEVTVLTLPDPYCGLEVEFVYSRSEHRFGALDAWVQMMTKQEYEQQLKE